MYIFDLQNAGMFLTCTLKSVNVKIHKKTVSFKQIISPESDCFFEN